MKKNIGYQIGYYTAALCLIAFLLAAPAIFGGLWLLLYVVTLPIIWEYIKQIRNEMD